TSTAYVCPVIGTVVQGTLTCIWAARATKAANAAMRASSRAQADSRPLASTRGRTASTRATGSAYCKEDLRGALYGRCRRQGDYRISARLETGLTRAVRAGVPQRDSGRLAGDAQEAGVQRGELRALQDLQVEAGVADGVLRAAR